MFSAFSSRTYNPICNKKKIMKTNCSLNSQLLAVKLCTYVQRVTTNDNKERDYDYDSNNKINNNGDPG
jgi:hypothetical protein